MPTTPLDRVPRAFTAGYTLGVLQDLPARYAKEELLAPDLGRALIGAYEDWRAGKTHLAPPDDNPTPARTNGDDLNRRLAALDLANSRIDASIPHSARLSYVLELAGWLVDGPTSTDTVEVVDGAGTKVAELPGAPRGYVELLQALRNLATVANNLLNAEGAAGLASDSEEAIAQFRLLHTYGEELEKLDDAVDQAYAALDWPRYPEKETRR